MLRESWVIRADDGVGGDVNMRTWCLLRTFDSVAPGGKSFRNKQLTWTFAFRSHSRKIQENVQSSGYVWQPLYQKKVCVSSCFTLIPLFSPCDIMSEREPLSDFNQTLTSSSQWHRAEHLQPGDTLRPQPPPRGGQSVKGRQTFFNLTPGDALAGPRLTRSIPSRGPVSLLKAGALTRGQRESQWRGREKRSHVVKLKLKTLWSRSVRQ